MKKQLSTPDTNVIVIKEYPSKMIAYDILNIQSRSFTVGDIRFLMSKGLDHESIIAKYNDACVNFDIYKLSLLDYFFHATTVTLFSNPQQTWIWNPKCKSCQKSIAVTVSYKNFFEFNDIVLEGYPLFITINGVELKMGFFTVQDWLDLKKPEYADYDIELLTFAFMIKNMEVAQAYEFIKSIVNLDDLHLLEQCEKLLGSHGLKPKELVCNECGAKDFYETELAVSDVTPFRQPADVIKSRIVFGQRN